MLRFYNMIKVDSWYSFLFAITIKRLFLLLIISISISGCGFAGKNPVIEKKDTKSAAISYFSRFDFDRNGLYDLDKFSGDLDKKLFYTENGSHPEQMKSFICTDFIDTIYIEMTIENCDNVVSICIGEAIADMLSYSISDNGLPYTAGVNPCDFDTSYAYTYASIPGGGTAGPYSVDSWTVDGNIYTETVANMADLTDSMNVWDNGGNWSHDSFTATIRGGNTAMTYGNIHLTQDVTGNSGVLLKNTTLNPKGSRITLDTGYHELVFTEPIENCTDTLVVVINCIPCENLYDGATTFELDNCNDNQSICVDIPANTLSAYTVSDNGSAYNGIVNPCNTDSFFRYDYSGFPDGGTFGPYLLQNWTVNGSIYLSGFNTVGDLVDSMNVWDVGANWEINAPFQTITGGNPANTYSDIEVVQILTNNPGTAPVTLLESVSSIEVLLDTGYHAIILYNTTNQCVDSFDLEVNCAPCPEYLGGTIINIMATHCDSSADVCLTVPFSIINDYTVSVNGIPYTETFSLCNMTDTEMQFDTGTYHILWTHNITGCLDSATVIVDCMPPVICADFIEETFVTLQSNDCNSLSELCVEIPFNEIADYIISDNNLPYTGDIFDCESGAGLALTPGFHEFIFSHNITGCSDTISSLVACMSSENIDISIAVLAIDTICLDTSQLEGAIISVNNSCEENSGEMALFTLDSQNYCLIIEGVEEGIAQACIEICDSYGFCDTTFINIEVTPLIIINPEMPPVANDDYAQTAEGVLVNIAVLANDEINGMINSFGIIDAPQNGTAIIRSDNGIEYTPNPGFCTPTMADSFSYALCNEVDCASATVFVEVSCEAVFVYDGFSPNGDGINEYFVINGAASNPDNILSVFNRWGGRVFFQKGYQNTWDGTWEGLDLPDATYFYYFEDGNGSTASGYVLIQR
ncbi:MAG: gliding motility-associated-like protein [Saprospiraceae bacterium]|jgi:gliding motility-associated-like protein